MSSHAPVQRTLNAPSPVLEGVGLHSGEMCRLRFLPAPADSGLAFRVGGETVPATPARARGSVRNTELRGERVRLSTVEHVLSALNGMGVDNAIVEMSAPEPPAADGSALPFARLLLEGKIVALDAPRRPFRVAAPAAVSEQGAAVLALPFEGFRLTYYLDYGERPPGRAVVDLIVEEDGYLRDIAPARTFALEEELNALREAGLAKGGSSENAVVVGASGYSRPLRFPDECARHKLLDMAGDLAALGVRPNGHFIGIRSGHALNQKMAMELWQRMQH